MSGEGARPDGPRRVRLFVAVDPQPEVRARLGAIQQALRRAVGQAGWTATFPKVPNLHVTLKFLGSVEAHRVAEVGAALSAVGSTDPFEIAFEGLGAFPSPSRPRILWAGVTRGARPLKSLAEQVDRYCSACGFEPEAREFSPHLTLARLKRARGSAASMLENVSPREAGSSVVTEVTLYRSDTDPAGPTYTPLAQLPLGKPATDSTD